MTLRAPLPPRVRAVALAVLALARTGPADAQPVRVAPGPLTRAHASLEGVTSCGRCHEPGIGVSAAKCLSCHAPIKARIAARKGVHRAVAAACTPCHREHGGVDAEMRRIDVQVFDHLAETGFALEGQHARLASTCKACHKERSYLAARPACQSCHADPHKAALGDACTRCHSTRVSFKEAAMFGALLSVARGPTRPKETEIVFTGLVDEENAQGGSRALVDAGWKADLAVVGEPTRLKVVTAHKGDLWLQMETTGKAAHGSTPELGRNAVLEMARIVELLETTYAKQLRTRRHPLLGSPTINVGTITGGSQPNIVPASCCISIDRRTIPGETEASVRREIKALLAKHHLRAGFLNIRNAACPALETDANLPLVRQLMACAGQREPGGVNYFCDAAVLSAGGIPSLVFGPGDIAQAHTADEWISLRSLENGTALLKCFLQSLP